MNPKLSLKPKRIEDIPAKHSDKEHSPRLGARMGYTGTGAIADWYVRSLLTSVLWRGY